MNVSTLTIARPAERSTSDVGILCAACLETLAPDGVCLNIGRCTDADTSAVRGSLQRGTASAVRPSAWTASGRVD